MKFRRLLIVAFILLVVVLGVVYVSSKGKVQLSLNNVSDSAEVSLLLNTGKEEENIVKTKNNATVTLPSGSYLVTITSGNSSVVRSVTVPSFFRTTTVSDSLEGEHKRTFVGTNPSPCMFYVGNMFYSAACGDDVTAIQKQIKPTLSTPGYTEQLNSADFLGSFVGAATAEKGTYLLLENYTDEGQLIELVVLSESASSQKRIAIPSDITGQLSITAGGSKVLVYSASDLTGYVYDEATNKLQKIVLPNVGESFGLRAVLVDNEAIVSTFAAASASDGVEGDLVTGNSKVYRQSFSGSSTDYELPELYSKAMTCGTAAICAVGANGLDVYTTSGKEPAKKTSYPGVSDLFVTNNGIRYIDKTGVLVYDPEKKTGFYEYSFGNYTSCGVSSVTSGYILCIIDTKNQKHALLVSATATAGSDVVDKQLLDILKNKDVSGVAAIDSIIYVIPNYGDVGIFTHDSETTARVNDAIDNVIRSSKIPKQQYYVINAGSPL